MGPALFFSLLIITVSFLPVFTLEAQEGRLFGPLAFTKTFAMASAAILSVTLVPALMVIFVRGRIVPEARNPLNRALIAVYRPVIGGVLNAKTLTIALALLVLGISVWPVLHIGTEFMPNLNEGTLLYMPTTLPGSVGDQVCGAVADPGPHHPHVPGGGSSVYGKAGPRTNGDRSGAARDVRDRHQPQTEGGVAARPHDRRAHSGDGPLAAVPRRLQRLDHADQGSHRHAVHRYPHAGWRQGHRQET